MRIQTLGVALSLFAASVSYAQQGPAFYGNPYYGGYAPTQTPPTYSPPYGYGSGTTSGTPTTLPKSAYYTPPRASDFPASRSGGTTYYLSPGRPVTTVITTPIATTPRVTMPVPTTSRAPVVTMAASAPQAARFRKTSQAILQDLPTSPPVPSEDKGNVTMIWQKVMDSVGQSDEPTILEDTPTSFRQSPKEKFWLGGGYLGMFLAPMRMVGPLVTSGSLADAHPGSLGQPSTSVLFGLQDVDFRLSSGFKVNAGMFLDDQNRYSLEWIGFMVFPSTQFSNFASDGTGNPLLARPVFATDLNRQAIFATAVPGVFSGDVSVETKSNLAGTEFNTRWHGYRRQRFQADGLLGVRYMRLAENLRIQDTINPLNGTVIPFNGNNFTGLMDQDNFSTENQFIGGQFGARLNWVQDYFTLGAFAKLGLGATLQQARIDGSTTFLSATGNQTAQGGVLALPSNIGVHNRTMFGVLPEFGANVGVNITQHVRLSLGYSAILWNSVLRPGRQIDTNVNTGLAPGSQNFGNVVGPVAPNYRFNDEFFWAHAFNFGVEVHY